MTRNTILKAGWKECKQISRKGWAIWTAYHKQLNQNKLSMYTDDPKFLKFSNFVTYSSLFCTFINGYANTSYNYDSKTDDKWEMSNEYEDNELLHKLVEFIDWGDIDVEYLVNKIPDLKQDLDHNFSCVYDFVKWEFENYKHYAKAIKYSERITDIEEQKLESLERYLIPKYDNSVSYDEYSKKIKEYENWLLR